MSVCSYCLYCRYTYILQCVHEIVFPSLIHPYSFLLQIKFAQSGEGVLFNVRCKDFFNNSRTCLLSVNEANQRINVRTAGMC